MNDFIEKIKLEVLEEAIKYLEELMPSEMICILNRDFCYEYINENPYMNILGYSKEDLLGKSPRKILHPSDLEKLDINLRIGADIGDDIPAFRIKHNNGSWKWVEIRGKVFQDENGETKILVISSDITDRIDTEKLLKESEEKYRLISENANDIIVILSQNFAIEYCNQSYYRVLGYQKGEVIGKTPKDFIHPDDYENAINALKKGFIRGEGMKEVRVKHRKGNSISNNKYHSKVNDVYHILIVKQQN